MAGILYDGRDAFRAGGTGIATYARTLGVLARQMGFSTAQVVSSAFPLSSKDPVWNEIRFHDVPAKGFSLDRALRVAWGSTLGALADVRPTLIPHAGAVVDPMPGSRVAFEQTFAAYQLFLLAEAKYRIHGRRAVMRFEAPPAVFHATSAVPLMARGSANIYTIHDIIPVRLPYATLTHKRYYYDLVRELCAKADHIVTVSEFSRQDIIRLTGMAEHRITNTYQSVSLPPALLARSDEAVAAELEHVFGLEMGEYFLFFSAIEPKKNVVRLIDAHIASGTKRPLILAGGLGWQFDEEVRRLKDERFLSYRIADGRVTPTRSVRQVEHVPLEQLLSLIRGARAVVFPSLYEGFGLPVLEAMLLGTPVITSNVASLPEVAGDAALLVNPHDTGSIARAIRTLDRDSDLRLDLIARGRTQAARFSPAAYEERVAALYKGYAS